MQQERYPVKAADDALSFWFTSVGKNGRILKVIKYSRTGIPGIYNLGFGDICPNTSVIDDHAVSNNGDHKKVLVTVAYTIYTFFHTRPDVLVYIQGTTSARNRLYRIGIFNNLHLIEADFNILGYHQDKWIPFSGEFPFDGFLIKSKNNTLVL
ncbi:MAG: hypothetical protein V4616_08350 [Bacteroidota bacterium]